MGRRARYGRAQDALANALQGRREQAIIATKIWTSGEVEGREQAAHALRLFGRVEIYQVMRTGRLDMIQVPYNPRRRGAEHRVRERLAHQLR